MLRDIGNYLFSMTFVTVAAIYGLGLPTLVTGNTKLVKEYYYDDALKSYILDIFLIAAYLWAGKTAVKALYPRAGLVESSIIIAITSMLITTCFMFLIPAVQSPSSFFVRWFKAVGFKAAIYDACLIVLTYLTMKAVHNLLPKV